MVEPSEDDRGGKQAGRIHAQQPLGLRAEADSVVWTGDNSSALSEIPEARGERPSDSQNHPRNETKDWTILRCEEVIPLLTNS